jgi:ferrous iron transport protein B
VALVVTDVENLKRNLLLFTQIKDLEIPSILVINMADRMEHKGITLDKPLKKNAQRHRQLCHGMNTRD